MINTSDRIALCHSHCQRKIGKGQSAVESLRQGRCPRYKGMFCPFAKEGERFLTPERYRKPVRRFTYFA